MNNNLTKKDIEDMEAEIEHRKCVVRKELLEHVKEARSLGDLSENFEYYAAKKEKNANEGRIRYLERMIRTANVVEDNSKDDEVGINKTITVYVEEDDELEVQFDCTQGTESIPRWAAEEGHEVTNYEQLGEASWTITVKKK